MVFGKKKQESREPDETVVLARSIAVALWTSKDVHGRYSVRFSLSRKEEDGQIRRTFRPEHLLQFPKAIADLAKTFAEVSTLPEEIRTELSHLADAMGRAIAWQLSFNGVAANSDTPDRLRVFG